MKLSVIFVFALCVIAAFIGQAESRWKGWKKIETTKRGLKNIESEAALGHCWTLLTCLDVSLRALAPFMPHLCQHLHQRLPFPSHASFKHDFPQELHWKDDELESDIKKIIDVVFAIRRLKKLFNVSAKHNPQVRIVSKLDVYTEFSGVIEDLGGCNNVTVSLEDEGCTKETVFDTVGSNATIYLPLPAECKKALEIDRETLERKKTKVLAELERIQNMTSVESYRIKVAPKVQEAHAKKIVNLENELSRIKYLHNFL